MAKDYVNRRILLFSHHMVLDEKPVKGVFVMLIDKDNGSEHVCDFPQTDIPFGVFVNRLSSVIFFVRVEKRQMSLSTWWTCGRLAL